jgi:hypothetical protein
MAEKTLRVVLASPGDVQTERDAVQSVIDELNRGVADLLGLQLKVSRWETDAYPALNSGGGQAHLDGILKIADCDILIGIFWTRFGRKIPSGKTGTEHEIRVAAQSHEEKGSPQVMLYFSKLAVDPTAVDLEQLKQVAEFRKEFSERGIYGTYDGPTEFPNILRQNLTAYLKATYPKQ